MEKFGAGRIAITPDSKKSDRINAARRIIQRCEFSDKCEKGLDGLTAWGYEWDEEKRIFSSEPKHDWSSHDGDGFSYGCVIAEEILPKEPKKAPIYPIKSTKSGIIITIPLDQLWEETRISKERY